MRQSGLEIAVIGSGIAGLSAAWLLGQRHHVTLYEAADRPGGHSNTVDAVTSGQATPVDTGFIVYNEATYPNLTALFAHLGVRTKPTDMSFGVSLDGGGLEYEGTGPRTLFAQRRNLIRPRFWSMLRDILRFYREAPALAATLAPSTSLGEMLDSHGYGPAFQRDHLLPMAAAIWSASADSLRDYPAAHFIRFCDNHGLLKVTGRPVWRTVDGGSRAYVARMLPERMRLGCGAVSVRRNEAAVEIRDATGEVRGFDHAVLACHADQALRLLDEPTEQEATLLGAFGYTRNRAVLHTDPRFMSKRRAVWAGWNYVGGRDPSERPHVTYWMNRLQGLTTPAPLFVTINPAFEPAPGSVLHEDSYDHPRFNAEAMRAQSALWSLQGRRRTWFCGAYFGSGFHEDALQAGLAVAEQLGGVRRPWTVADESGRISLDPAPAAAS